MEKKLKITAIVQARLKSSRLPNKVLEKINSKTIIEIINERLKVSKLINNIILSIPKTDFKLIKFFKKKKIKYSAGSENNVLKRFYQCAKKDKSDLVIRVTADCPLVDAEIIDKMIISFKSYENLDLLTNYFPPTFPDGLDIAIFNFKTLEYT